MDEAHNPWAVAQRRVLVQGALAAIVATAIALWFHLLAGGAMPALPGVVVPLLLAFAGCVLLAHVRMPWLRLLSSVGSSQVLFHGLFVLGASEASQPSHTHGHHAVGVGQSSPLMVLAHVVAAVLTAALLRHGELLLARIVAALRRLGWRFLHALRVAPLHPTAAPATLADEDAWVPVARLLLLTSAVRRGPPLLAVSPAS